MNILITGAKGYIGSNLSRALRKDGYHIIEFDLNIGDITKPSVLNDYKSAGVDYIFHLAGRTFVPDSWKNPFPFYETNLLGTANILEFCRINGVPMTYLSSYVYGTPKFLPITENHPLEAYNPYSQSKLFADQLCQFYIDKYQVNATILRLFNLYGPGQPPYLIIPELISKVLDPNIPVIEINDMRPKRDFVFISDLINALSMTLHRKVPGVYNIGSGHSFSVEEILNIIFSIAGYSKPVKDLRVERQNEIFDLSADLSHVYEVLGWKTSIGIVEGISECIAAEKIRFA